MGKDLKKSHPSTLPDISGSEPDAIGEIPAYAIEIIVDDELQIPRYARDDNS
jgi:hypothetical protein